VNDNDVDEHLTPRRTQGEEPFMVVLKPVPEATKEGRDLIEFAFGSWGLDTYTPRLVVSELVTNAVRVSPEGRYVVVRAHLNAGVPTIEVWDGSDEPPVLRTGDVTDEGGRGLFIVDLLCVRWGVRPCTEGGKVVWAELPRDGGSTGAGTAAG
jgi:hypothetical protein